jgi:alpha-N-arabinofuranosidase
MEKLNTLSYSAVLTGMNNNNKDIKIAWDEWNMFGWLVSNVNDDARYTLQNAIVTASVLNMFIRNATTIGMANYSTFVNINGAISVNGDVVITRPQYHVFDLIGNNTGDTLYQADVSGDGFTVEVPQSQKLGRESIWVNLMNTDTVNRNTCKVNYIDVAISGNDDGMVYASIINKHPDEDLDVEIDFQKEDALLQCDSAYMIYHDEIEAANTKENPDNIKIETFKSPVVIENVCRFQAKKHSVNLLKFKIC